MSATTSVGTNAADEQAWSWTIDPLDGWTVVPSTRSEQPEAIGAWQDGLVETVRELVESRIAEVQGPEDGISAEDRAELHQQVVDAVENLRTYADEVPPGTRVVALVGVQDHGPVPVLVSVALGEPDTPDETLMAAVGATGGNPFNPPDVEYLDLPDGDGIRVTRLDIDPSDGSAWASVGVGRRTEHPDAVVDTVLLWRTQDLFLLDGVGEALDELLPAVRITRSAA